jgi:Mrp family chromosome partitioning ATPase
MSAFDQAFIKAYSQQNPALAAAKAAPAKKTCEHQSPVKAAVSLEDAKPAASALCAEKAVQAVPVLEKAKTRSKRRGKSPGKLASESIFKAIDQTIAEKKSSKRTSSTKKTAFARRAKKALPTTADESPSPASENIPKKPTTKSDSSSGRSLPETFYRLDPPATATDGGNSTSMRPSVPTPHTDVIFSGRNNTVLPQREPVPKQNALPSSEAHYLKNSSTQKAEPAAEKKAVAAKQTPQEAPAESQTSKSFSDGWTEDFTRVFSNLEQNSAAVDPPEPVREPDVPKTPAEIIESLAASMKQYSVAQVPLPEKKNSREEIPQHARPERNAALEKNAPFSEKSNKQNSNESASRKIAKESVKESPAEKPDLAEAPPLPTIRLFQPMLQVDHFAWPKVCGRLETGADAELERVIESLLAAQIRGKKVFALGGCHAGDGASSLLLSTARRLAAQGLKTALVEADWRQPQLARRLGLLPQYGWEDVLSGRLPLEEVLIESIAERLVILPVREPFEVSELPDEAANRLAESWNSLRHHFDIVLVDPGPLCNSTILDQRFVGVMACRIDATLMVKNLRRHDSDEFDAVVKALNDAGPKILGIVENFAG